MAASDLSANLQEEATCAICLDYFTDPVMTDCGHNFCRECISRCWGQTEGPFPCPECREMSPQTNLRPNRPLAKMAEMARQLHPPSPVPQGLCGKHREPLKLFCEEDQALLCLTCERSRDHWTHRVSPVEEAAEDYQGKLEKLLEHLRKQMGEALQFQTQGEETFIIWQKMVESQKQNVTAEFDKLRSFLAEEEHRLLQKLEEEESETLPRLKENKIKLIQQSHSLEELIGELEERCQRPALSLLQDVRDILHRSQDVKLQLPEVVSMELRTVCRVPGLVEMLRQFRGDVTLDPATANPELVLSEDRRSVRRGDVRQALPDSQERFDPGPCVLGCESFTSGRHYWEVEVGERVNWALGVCKENVNRKETGELSAGNGFWILVFFGNYYYSPDQTFIPLREAPRRIGIFLDHEAGHISFYSVTDGSLLFMFSQVTFSGTLRPLFSPLSCSPIPMTICQVIGEAGESFTS